MPTKTKSSSSYGRINCKKAVWEKSSGVRGMDKSTHRRDAYGNVIHWKQYGSDTRMGWNIDHIKPKALGGSDGLRNLQVLQTTKNKSLGCIIKKKSCSI
jgi:hypothetical protein